jgi:hypothetical protein
MSAIGRGFGWADRGGTSAIPTAITSRLPAWTSSNVFGPK